MAAIERTLWQNALRLLVFYSHREKKWKIFISLCFFTWWLPKILIMRLTQRSHVSNLKVNWNQDPETRQFLSFSMSPSLIEQYPTIVHYILLTWSKITSYAWEKFPCFFFIFRVHLHSRIFPSKKAGSNFDWQSPPSLPMQGWALISQGSAENLWSINSELSWISGWKQWLWRQELILPFFLDLSREHNQ